MPRKPVATEALSGLELVEAQVQERHAKQQRAAKALAKSFTPAARTLLEEFQDRRPTKIDNTTNDQFQDQLEAVRDKLKALWCSPGDALKLTEDLADAAYGMVSDNEELAWYTAWAACGDIRDTKGGANAA